MVKLSRSQEDYLEALFIISKNKRAVRVKDVSSFLDVKNPSVLKAVRHLEDTGLARHEHYGYIELTAEGYDYAAKIYQKHMMIMDFFTDVLGVPEDIAEQDACKMEHFLHKITLEKMEKYLGESKKPRDGE